jgi:cbb3-type cytochrome oxidase maturation protein
MLICVKMPVLRFSIQILASFLMNILFMLIGVSLFAALIFLALFIWAVKSGQYEDNYTPSVRILFEDESEDLHKTD